MEEAKLEYPVYMSLVLYLTSCSKGFSLLDQDRLFLWSESLPVLLEEGSVAIGTEHCPVRTGPYSSGEVGLVMQPRQGKQGLPGYRYFRTKILHELKVGDTYGK